MDMFDYYTLRYNCDCLPDHIIVPSKMVGKELEKAIKDFPQDNLKVNIRVATHPKFVEIIDYFNGNEIKKLKEKKIKRNRFYFDQIHKPHLEVLYISTSINEDDCCEHGKVDQYTQFRLVYNALELSGFDFKIYIKPHPVEDKKVWENEVRNYKRAILIRDDSAKYNDRKYYETCMRYDIAVGFYSTLLVELRIMKIPVVFTKYIDMYCDLDLFFQILYKQVYECKYEFDNFYNTTNDIIKEYFYEHKRINDLIDDCINIEKYKGDAHKETLVNSIIKLIK